MASHDLSGPGCFCVVNGCRGLFPPPDPWPVPFAQKFACAGSGSLGGCGRIGAAGCPAWIYECSNPPAFPPRLSSCHHLPWTHTSRSLPCHSFEHFCSVHSLVTLTTTFLVRHVKTQLFALRSAASCFYSSIPSSTQKSIPVNLPPSTNKQS